MNEKQISQKSIFETLEKLTNKQDVYKKQNLDYIPWSVAFKNLFISFDNVEYEVLQNDEGLEYFGNEATGYFVKTKITVEGITKLMRLPITDYNNNVLKQEKYFAEIPKYKKEKKEFKGRVYYSKLLDENGDPVFLKDNNGDILFQRIFVPALTVNDINTSIQRCFTKNIAMFGYGIQLYTREEFGNDINNSTGEKIEVSQQNYSVNNTNITKQELINLVNNATNKDYLLKCILGSNKITNLSDMPENKIQGAYIWANNNIVN